MAWLSGYSKRIKLTIDYNKIDSSLSNFPVTVFFTSSQGEEIFDEFDADSDYMKCAFTSNDGTTQLYAEKELFDVSEEKAIYHVKVPSISSSANTIIYYYFDNSHSDNTDYIGAIGTTAGANVWDSNFKAVYHMVDDTTSTIKDSTSNNNDGTKKGANEPIEATGKVGQGQSFDGSNDYITGANPSVNVPVTVEAIVARGSVVSGRIFHYDNSTSNYAIIIGQNSLGGDNIVFAVGASNASLTNGVALTATKGTFYHLVGVFTSSSAKTIYQNGVVKTGKTDDALGGSKANQYLNLGRRADNTRFADCKIDEFRFSSTDRSAAWIKATYNSLWDTLLTYGSAEMSKNINETLHTVDTLAKSGIKNNSETLHTVDTILKSGIKALAESFNILDSFFIGLVIHLAETLHLADGLAKSGIKQLGETVGIVDSIVKSGIRLLNENVMAIDTIVRSGTKALVESLNTIDSMLKSGVRQLSEGISIVDSIAKSGIRYLSESIHAVDSYFIKFIFNELLTVIDSVGKTGIKQLSESFNLTDAITNFIMKISESFHLIDTMVTSGVRQLGESLHIIDDIGKTGVKLLSESFNLTDVITNFIIVISESLHFVDSIATSGVRQLGESLHAIDSILHRIFVNEVVAIVDAVGVTAIKLMYETLHIVDWFWGKLRRKISDWLKQDKNTSDWTKIEKNDTNWTKES